MKLVDSSDSLPGEVTEILSPLLEELSNKPERDQWQIGFECAQRMRTTMHSRGISWQEHEPTEYLKIVRHAAQINGLDPLEIVVSVQEAWNKVRFPYETDPIEFVHTEAILTRTRARVFVSDFPDEDIRRIVETVLTMVLILDDLSTKMGKKAYLPVRSLGSALGKDKNFAAHILTQLERLDYIRRKKVKSKRRSPPISLGNRYFSAQLELSLNPTKNLRDKGSEGSDPKEPYDPKGNEGEKGHKGVGLGPTEELRSRAEVRQATGVSNFESLSPSEKEQYLNLKSRQDAERQRLREKEEKSNGARGRPSPTKI